MDAPLEFLRIMPSTAQLVKMGFIERLRLYIFTTAAHRLLDPIRDLVCGQILSGGHAVPLRLKIATTIGQTVGFRDQATAGAQQMPAQLDPAQHAVSTMRLTHKRRFDILDRIKSNVLSIINNNTYLTKKVRCFTQILREYHV